MRLEHGDDPTVATCAGGGKRGRNLGRMVSVVVNNRLAWRVVDDFKPALGSAEGFQCGSDRFEGLSDLAGQGECRQCVHCIVGSRDVEQDLPECFSMSADRKAGFEIFSGEVCYLVVSFGTESVGNRTGMGCTNPLRSFVICAVENLARCLTDEAVVNSVDGREILVEIEMLRLDVQHDGMFRMIIDECAITLVSLCDKPLSLRVPAGIGSEDGDFRPDIMAGFKSASPQDMSGHGRSGRFAVHPTYDDPFLGVHDGCQSIGSSRHRNFLTCRRVESWVACFDGGGINDDIRSVNALR